MEPNAIDLIPAELMIVGLSLGAAGIGLWAGPRLRSGPKAGPFHWIMLGGCGGLVAQSVFVLLIAVFYLSGIEHTLVSIVFYTVSAFTAFVWYLWTFGRSKAVVVEGGLGLSGPEPKRARF